MSERYVAAMRAEEVAPGGMKSALVEGRAVVVCNAGGRFHAFERRCGHMSAPLELGTLDGTVLTCPMHCAQFDVTTGEALSGPVPHDYGTEPPPPKIALVLSNVGALMEHIDTESLRTFETKVEEGVVWVKL
jgi:nitrite reductase/ring-hydroxylating ferredoxin subunit